MSQEQESILLSLKKLIGPSVNNDDFDTDLIMNINSLFGVLNQLGVGPSEIFSITGSDETWSDFMPDSCKAIPEVKSYMFMKLKLLFDPPSSSFVINSYERLISEFEWRANVHAETP